MDMLGMGVSIVLRDLFSRQAGNIGASSARLTKQMQGDALKTTAAWKTFGVSVAAMVAGGALIGSLVMLGKVSLQKAADLEVFRLQFQTLTKSIQVGNAVFEQMKTAAVNMPFTLPQVMGASKMLLAYGISAQNVGKELKVAGDWASMFNERIEVMAQTLGKVHTGAFGQAMRFAQARGIGWRELMAAGAPVIQDKRGTFKSAPGADPEKFIEAFNKVVAGKFPNAMQTLMTTIPGMLTNMTDRMIMLGAAIGDEFKPAMKELFQDFIKIFDPQNLKGFATAVGQGLGLVLKGILWILTPLRTLMTWLIDISKQHPNIVKIGVVLMAVAGSLLFLLGASLLVFVAWTKLEPIFSSVALSLSGVLPVIALVAAAAAALYMTWTTNFLGVADTITRWWNTAKAVFLGVYTLIASLQDGVGRMSMGMANSLQKAGLLDVTISIFMAFYRVYQVCAGLWSGLMLVAKGVGYLGGIIFWLLTPVWNLIYGLGKLVGLFTDAGNAASPNTWKDLGKVMGAVVGIFYAARLAVWLYNISLAGGKALMGAYMLLTNATAIRIAAFTLVTKGATLATRLWNAALMVNPIILVAMGAMLAAYGVAKLIEHMRKYHTLSSMGNWFSEHLGRATINAGWLAQAGTLVMKYWEPLMNFFAALGRAIGTVLGGLFTWIKDNLNWAFNWIGKLIDKIQNIPMFKNMTAADLPLDPDKRPVPTSTLTVRQAESLSIASPAAKTNIIKDSLESVTASLNKFAGHGPEMIMVTSHTHLDGREIATTVTKHQRNSQANGSN